RKGLYTTLLMSTGLTFGTISSLYGFTHHHIDQTQYTWLVTVIILSAVVPTLIAERFFRPKTEPLPKETSAFSVVTGERAESEACDKCSREYWLRMTGRKVGRKLSRRRSISPGSLEQSFIAYRSRSGPAIMRRLSVKSWKSRRRLTSSSPK